MPSIPRPLEKRNRPSVADRLWAKINKGGPIPAHCPELGPCWVWTASHNPSGYGQMWAHGKLVVAHRIAYELANGPIAPEYYVCHKCDNRSCCNPAHLFLGTAWDNNQDTANKGRVRHAQREQHGSAKLTLDQARAIRAIYATGNVTQEELARTYHLHKSTIWHLLIGRTWRE